MAKVKQLTLWNSDTGPEAYRDAPICVQLIGYRHQDQALMNNAVILDGIINGNSSSAANL